MKSVFYPPPRLRRYSPQGGRMLVPVESKFPSTGGGDRIAVGRVHPPHHFVVPSPTGGELIMVLRRYSPTGGELIMLLISQHLGGQIKKHPVVTAGCFLGRKENMTNLQVTLYHIFQIKKTKKLLFFNFYFFTPYFPRFIGR